MDTNAAEGSSQELSRREFLREVFHKTVYAGILGGIATIDLAGLTYEKLVAKASCLPANENDGLAILVSKPTGSLEGFIEKLFDAYTARIELEFGFRAMEIIPRATSQDLYDVLSEPRIQNVCVMGHGTYSNWTASDRVVTIFDLMEFHDAKKIKKLGRFLKHTCSYFDKPVKTTLAPKEKFTNELVDRMIEIVHALPQGRLLKSTEFYEPIERMYISTADGAIVPESTLSSNVREKVQNLNKYLREIYQNPDNLKTYVFGVPIFKPENISYWLRVTTPIDFMIDPFAQKNSPVGRLAVWMYNVGANN